MEESPSITSLAVVSPLLASTGIPEATGSENANAALVEGYQKDSA